MPMTLIRPISPKEYLKQERASKEKNEYFDGKVTALAGASMAHNHIVANLLREIGSYLKGKSCKILPSDMRVTIPSGKAYMYPDVIVYCGQAELEDDRFDTLKNPAIIFEVLSPSTEQHDRGRKFSYYREIPSFREYVLIDSTECFVEVSRRQDDDSWKFESTADPYGHMMLSSIQYSLHMEELYRNVF
jgi:Uma2 family endonuclease